MKLIIWNKKPSFPQNKQFQRLFKPRVNVIHNIHFNFTYFLARVLSFTTCCEFIKLHGKCTIRAVIWYILNDESREIFDMFMKQLVTLITLNSCCDISFSKQIRKTCQISDKSPQTTMSIVFWLTLQVKDSIVLSIPSVIFRLFRAKKKNPEKMFFCYFLRISKNNEYKTRIGRTYQP